MNISGLSTKYEVSPVSVDNVKEIYELCMKNTLFYLYCPPYVTESSILEDLRPSKSNRVNINLGFYDHGKLIAILYLVDNYPEEGTVFIRLFMTDVSVQHKGVGTLIISELSAALALQGYKKLRLGWVEGNLQSQNFWQKNVFTTTGESYGCKEYYFVTVAERPLRILPAITDYPKAA